MTHPYPLHWFSHNRKQQYDAAEKILDIMFMNGTFDFTENLIALYADFKWGKRVVMEICALLKKSQHVKCFAFLAEKKNDMADQRAEQALYDIETLPHTRQHLQIKINGLKKELAKDPSLKLIFFYDEGDLGDGQEQVYDDYIRPLLSHSNNVAIVAISATNFTIIDALSKAHKEHCIVVGECHPNYVSIADFIAFDDREEYTIISDEAFYENGSFTPDGKNAVEHWLKYILNSRGVAGHKVRKNFIIRSKFVNNRSNYKFQKNVQKNMDVLCTKILDKVLVDVEIVDQINSGGFEWMRGDRWANNFRLICVNKTFTRGTETDIQPYCYAYYDPSSSYVNTLAQRLGRFANYFGEFGIKFFLSAEGFAAVKIHKLIKQELANKTPWSQIIEKLKLDRPSDERVIPFAQRLTGKIGSPTTKISEDPREFEFYDDEISGTSKEEVIENLRTTISRHIEEANSNAKFCRKINPTRERKIENIEWNEASGKIIDSYWKQGKEILDHKEVQRMKFQGLDNESHHHRFYICYDNNGKMHLCTMVHTGKQSTISPPTIINNKSSHCKSENLQ
jgi:hypothetical protein